MPGKLCMRETFIIWRHNVQFWSVLSLTGSWHPGASCLKLAQGFKPGLLPCPTWRAGWGQGGGRCPGKRAEGTGQGTESPVCWDQSPSMHRGDQNPGFALSPFSSVTKDREEANEPSGVSSGRCGCRWERGSVGAPGGESRGSWRCLLIQTELKGDLG